MRRTLAILGIALCLSGCAFASGMRDSDAWHAKDLESFVMKNYPPGTDEQDLIRDFSAHGYKYWNTGNQHYLVVKRYCDGIVMRSRAGSHLVWESDESGKITKYERINPNVTISCLYSSPF